MKPLRRTLFFSATHQSLGVSVDLGFVSRDVDEVDVSVAADAEHLVSVEHVAGGLHATLDLLEVRVKVRPRTERRVRPTLHPATRSTRRRFYVPFRHLENDNRTLAQITYGQIT